MRYETPAQRFRREAEQCQINAEEAENPRDQEAWRRLADDWTKLALAAQLNPLLERGRTDPD
jgi:hypothetical protein